MTTDPDEQEAGVVYLITTRARPGGDWSEAKRFTLNDALEAFELRHAKIVRDRKGEVKLERRTMVRRTDDAIVAERMPLARTHRWSAIRQR